MPSAEFPQPTPQETTAPIAVMDPSQSEWSLPTLHVSAERSGEIAHERTVGLAAGMGAMATEAVTGTPELPLAAVPVAGKSAKPEATGEKTHLEALFAPREAFLAQPGASEQAGGAYGYLFTDAYDEKPVDPVMPRHIESPRDVVTPAGEAAAKDALQLAMTVDQRLGDIILENPAVQHNFKLGAAHKPLSELLRTDNNLRLTVGTYLLDKLKNHIHPNVLPFQARRETGKGTPVPGYEDVRSNNEYIALLALGMLDGTFDPQRAGTDTVAYDRHKDTGPGQHRYAAMQLLRDSGEYNRQQ